MSQQISPAGRPCAKRHDADREELADRSPAAYVNE